MELKIEEYQLPDQIRFNYESLKAELAEKVQIYETMVYGEDQIKEAKVDRAKLTKLKKALNDERIRREKEYMIPFNEFKAQVNEIISIIDKPIQIIDRQVKDYEEKQKIEKRTLIGAYYTDETDHPEWLRLPQIFDEKWLNASVSLKNVKDQIDQRLEKIRSDIEAIESLQEFSFEAMTEYKRSLDISRAIAEGQRLASIQKAKAEAEAKRKAAEEEAKRREAELSEKAWEDMKTTSQESAGATSENSAQKAEEIHTEEIKDENEAPTASWISFSAFLTIDQALMLKDFFKNNNIEFKKI